LSAANQSYHSLSLNAVIDGLRAYVGYSEVGIRAGSSPSRGKVRGVLRHAPHRGRATVASPLGWCRLGRMTPDLIVKPAVLVRERERDPKRFRARPNEDVDGVSVARQDGGRGQAELNQGPRGSSFHRCCSWITWSGPASRCSTRTRLRHGGHRREAGGRAGRSGPLTIEASGMVAALRRWLEEQSQYSFRERFDSSTPARNRRYSSTTAILNAHRIRPEAAISQSRANRLF
jgi:hypothetical protein